jgi:hypothetical protein
MTKLGELVLLNEGNNLERFLLGYTEMSSLVPSIHTAREMVLLETSRQCKDPVDAMRLFVVFFHTMRTGRFSRVT